MEPLASKIRPTTLAEFVEGFQFLFDFKKTVTIFGSARFQPHDHWHREAEKLAGLLAQEGFAIITGGGQA